MNDYKKTICDLLGETFDYADYNYKELVLKCSDALKANNSPSYQKFQQFADAINELDIRDIQELYTRTFDLNPICALELGWHIYGESYERGAFIVKMRETLRKLEIEETTELPDHMRYVLMALGRMESYDASEFLDKYVNIALTKMLSGLSDKDNPFENLLLAIQIELNSIFAIDSEGITNA